MSENGWTQNEIPPANVGAHFIPWNDQEPGFRSGAEDLMGGGWGGIGGSGGMRPAKATANAIETAASPLSFSSVLVKFTDDWAGTTLIGTEFNVLLPKTPWGDWNIATGNMLGLVVGDDAHANQYVAVWPGPDAKVGSIRIWGGTVATIPQGWRLAGTGGTGPDLRGRFPVGHVPGGLPDLDHGEVGDYTTLNSLGSGGSGSGYHKRAIVDHASHGHPHSHTVDRLQVNAEEVTSTPVSIWQVDDPTTSESGSGGPALTHPSIDIRPPWMVVAFIERYWVA